MFKAILTLFRGRAHEAAKEFTERHALAILRQQIRDCVATVASARKAVAVAIAPERTGGGAAQACAGADR